MRNLAFLKVALLGLLALAVVPGYAAAGQDLSEMLASSAAVEATMRELNARLYAQLGKRDFVALAFARLEPSTGALRLTNAGLPDPYVVTASGPTPVVVPGPRLPLGLKDQVDYQAVEVRMRWRKWVCCSLDCCSWRSLKLARQ